MISTHLHKSSKPHKPGTLASLVLVIMLVACGTNAANQSSPTRPSSGSMVNQPTKTPISVHPDADNVPALNASEITIDIRNLHILTEDGFQCPFNDLRIPMDNLVLATNRTVYSQDEINQIRAYVNENPSAWRFLEGNKAPAGLPPSPELPPTLRWVPGAAMDQVPGGMPSNEQVPCGVTLELSNTGNTPIQIPSVDIRLKENPKQNTYQYHLIDRCTVMSQSQIDAGGCTPSLGDNPHCTTYIASFQLGIGRKDTVFSSTPQPAGSPPINDQGTPLPCGILTVAPNAQVNLIFFFSLAQNVPQSIIYDTIPEFTVETADGGRQVLSLSQLASTLTFASASQFSCYGLQGTTFVLEQSPVYSPNHLWCM